MGRAVLGFRWGVAGDGRLLVVLSQVEVVIRIELKLVHAARGCEVRTKRVVLARLRRGL